MRIFFHLVGPDRMILDDTGVEVVNVEEGERCADEVITEQAFDTLVSDAGEGWTLRACDASGQVLFDRSLSQPIAPVWRSRVDEKALQDGSDMSTDGVGLANLQRRWGS